MTDEEEDKHDRELVHKALDQLSEQFDSVRIFVSCHEGKGSRRYTFGTGNFWTNYGMIKAWLIAEEAVLKHEAIQTLEDE